MFNERELIRHFVATIAYRATKALRDAPITYAEISAGKGARSAREIIHHITGVLTYAHSFFEHYESTYLEDQPWHTEIHRFYEVLSKLDRSLQERAPREVSVEQLLQGPLSDALAHVGQLLMLRRLAGSPVPSENFIYADITKGTVGPNQPEPVAPDE
jgi:hypothetical protein